MRAIRRIVGFVLLLLPLGSGGAQAQAQSLYALTYQPAVPLANTKDFTDNFAWRGIGLDYKRLVTPTIALGLSLGWHVFDQQTDEVVSAFGVDVSGDQFRYVNSFPILVNASYVFGTPGRKSGLWAAVGPRRNCSTR